MSTRKSRKSTKPQSTTPKYFGLRPKQVRFGKTFAAYLQHLTERGMIVSYVRTPMDTDKSFFPDVILTHGKLTPGVDVMVGNPPYDLTITDEAHLSVPIVQRVGRGLRLARKKK